MSVERLAGTDSPYQFMGRVQVREKQEAPTLGWIGQ